MKIFRKRIRLSILWTWADIWSFAGWGHPDLTEPIAEHTLPHWVFAGARDQNVNLRYFYAGLNKPEALGHKAFALRLKRIRGIMFSEACILYRIFTNGFYRKKNKIFRM